MNTEIHPRVHLLNIWWEAIQTDIGACLVKGKVNALVDTGPPQPSADIITSVLKEHNLTPGDIDLILNTHGHSDHIGGNKDIKAAGDVKIFVHKGDALLMEDYALSFDKFYAPGKDNLEQQKAYFLAGLGPELPVDRYLEDNDLIDLGDGIELRVVHIPGHTPGSVGFYWEKEGILIGGDSIQGLNAPGGFIPIMYDLISYEKSIQRLQGMDIKTLLFSHPYRGIRQEPSMIKQGKEVVKEYLSDSLLVARGLIEAVKKHVAGSDKRTLVESADLIIGELPEEWGFKPIAEIPVPEFSLGTIAFSLAQFRDA